VPDFLSEAAFAMKGLTIDLLSRACRTFLTLAYPEGEQTIPATKKPYLHLDDARSLESVLQPPVCQPIPWADGCLRGYALRLGSAWYPHLKLQVVDCDQSGTWVFTVDTHDAIRVEPTHADFARLAQLQGRNRQLKEQIERAWEAEGLLTFHGLLRRELDQTAGPDAPPA
jgi:hypothetical protein